MSPDADVLAEMQLFQGVPAESIQTLIDNSETHTLGSDEVLFEQGEDSSGSFFVVLKGEIGIRKMMRKDKSTVTNFSKGDFFGELALFTRDQRLAEAVALKPAELLEIPRSSLGMLKDQDPQALITIYENMFETMAGRFNALAQKAEKTQFWL